VNVRRRCDLYWVFCWWWLELHLWKHVLWIDLELLAYLHCTFVFADYSRLVRPFIASISHCVHGISTRNLFEEINVLIHFVSKRAWGCGVARAPLWQPCEGFLTGLIRFSFCCFISCNSITVLSSMPGNCFPVASACLEQLFCRRCVGEEV
jgi:hypothetical protein